MFYQLRETNEKSDKNYVALFTPINPRGSKLDHVKLKSAFGVQSLGLLSG